MKKVFLVSILLFLAAGFAAQAQLEKGKYFIAGSNRLEFNKGTQKDKYDGEVDDASKQSYFDFDFQPRVGYTFIDNLVGGLFMDVDLYSSKYKDGNGYEVKGATFIIGPFARYYFPVSDKLIPYAEAQVGGGIDTFKDRYDSGDEWTKYNETVFTYRLGGGATYFFNDMIGADMFLGFSHESYKHKIDESEASRSGHSESVIYNEFILQLGVVVLLNK
jgi:hypothetical protein